MSYTCGCGACYNTTEIHNERCPNNCVKNVINILAGVASVREELHCAIVPLLRIAQQLVKVRLSTCLWLTGMHTKSIRVTSLCLTTAE